MSETQAKSKAELRAERRAIQEAQRAAKLAKSNQKPQQQTKTKTENKTPTICTSPPESKATDKASKFRAKNVNSKEAQISSPKSEVVQSHTKSLVPQRKQESHRVHLFRHLREADKREDIIGSLGLGKHSPIHPCFLALGVNFDEGRIWGANDRCLGFLDACEALIRTHEPPPIDVPDSTPNTVDQSLFARNFGPKLQKHVDFLDKCRLLAVTIRNTYQFLKQTLNQLDSVENWNECRTQLLAAINDYRQTAIYLAGEAIAERASAAIRAGECICTFGYSSLVARVLERAWKGPGSSTTMPMEDVESSKKIVSQDATSGDGVSRGTQQRKPFSVLVVDSRPRFEGRRMLARLSKAGIPCEYTHIAALPMLAHKVSLAIVGAHALLNNGYVLARIGTAQVANLISAIAHAPTLVCAETYKFWERAQSDAFEYNELGDPDDIWRGPRGSMSDPNVGIPGCGPFWYTPKESEGLPNLHDWRSNPKLHLLHLVYDVLPPELVAAVVTEKGTLPTTSVPVVLRVKQATSVPL